MKSEHCYNIISLYVLWMPYSQIPDSTLIVLINNRHCVSVFIQCHRDVHSMAAPGVDVYNDIKEEGVESIQ